MIALLTAPVPADAPAGTQCLQAGQDGRACGTVWYRIAGDTVELLRLTAEDPAVADGLARAALQRGRTAGCLCAVCREPDLAAQLIAREGFCPHGQGALVMLEAFFGRGCRSAR
ncbi:MAG: hypothetical protein IKI50_04235 [Clostridia bacterium]|nr:hypothetical protein [Clostridia bacterium]